MNNDSVICDPFEPTPLGFHLRIEQKLMALQSAKREKRRSLRWAIVLAVCLVLAAGTALALKQLGVLYFLTERTLGGAATDAAIVQPTAQNCDSALLNAVLRDAYWDGETLSISLSVYPKDGEEALYLETDVGVDGESFDKIWWQGEVVSFDQWRAGRRTIELGLPKAAASIPCSLSGWDWVQDEQGETLLIQLKAADMTKGAALTVTLQSRVLDTDITESAALTATLPAMNAAQKKEEK